MNALVQKRMNVLVQKEWMCWFKMKWMCWSKRKRMSWSKKNECDDPKSCRQPCLPRGSVQRSTTRSIDQSHHFFGQFSVSMSSLFVQSVIFLSHQMVFLGYQFKWFPVKFVKSVFLFHHPSHSYLFPGFVNLAENWCNCNWENEKTKPNNALQHCSMSMPVCT